MSPNLSHLHPDAKDIVLHPKPESDRFNPGRKVARKEALAIAENVLLEAERRREEANEAEARRGDPPYPHELVARVREMAEDYSIMDDYQNGKPTSGKAGPIVGRWLALTGKFPSADYLRAGADLLAILEGE